MNFFGRQFARNAPLLPSSPHIDLAVSEADEMCVQYILTKQGCSPTLKL